jgi:hypothetical protein
LAGMSSKVTKLETALRSSVNNASCVRVCMRVHVSTLVSMSARKCENVCTLRF